jgi:protein involved in polysaccharide export with SLBB domain
VRHSGGAVSRPQASRWLAGAVPDLDGISATCSALRVPVLDFLNAAGYVDLSNVGVVIERVDVTGLTKAELLREIARRIPDATPDRDGATVTHLPTHPDDGGLFNPNVIWGPPTADTAHRDTQ